MKFSLADRAALRAWNAANVRARSEHARTQADHALPYGCELCTRGATSPDAAGFETEAGLLFCQSCINLAGAKHLIAKAVA